MTGMNGDGFHGVTAINPPRSLMDELPDDGPVVRAHSRGTVMFTWAIVGLPLVALAVAAWASFGYALAFIAVFWLVTAAFAMGRVVEQRYAASADLHPWMESASQDHP